MIVSASRRADIPAQYAPWFLNRARAGHAVAVNPFDARRTSRVSLRAEDVDAVVFWTRDPRPLMPHLGELSDLGLSSYFQFTLLDYPRALHPAGLKADTAVAAFLDLTKAVGPDRVLWRYDPVMLCNLTPPALHRARFAALCRALEGATRRVTVSLFEPYRKTRKRMRQAGVDLLAPDEAELADLLSHMVEQARAHGMVPCTCACDHDLARFGFEPAACVDAGLIRRLFGKTPPAGKDPHQRKACLCARSVDIGMYDACTAGCAYCYATTDPARSAANRRAHDPRSPSLLGWRDAPSAPERLSLL